MSADRFADIRARLAAASGGPWKALSARVGHYENGGFCTIANVVTWEGPDADAEFIANAPTDIGRLLAEVDRLRRERNDAIKGRDDLPMSHVLLAQLERAEAEVDRLRDALRENVGDSYNLLTQGESPTQLRQPSARRIYDGARAALAPAEGDG